MKFSLTLLIVSIFTFSTLAQTQLKSIDFSLSSPFTEPDGRSDFTTLSNGDFVTIAKTKGSLNSKSEFVLERYDNDLNKKWSTPLSCDITEDYKDVFYNGSNIVLLSVIHLNKEKITKLMFYKFNPDNGNLIDSKQLESYQVGDWENSNTHKGKVKETFIDVICEHVNANFVTPIEFKHNIHFSPDNQKFISYVYNYGEKNLTASVAIYDTKGNLLQKGKVGIDNDYINHGLYINNDAEIFILNANKLGKLNLIKFNLSTKDFQILEIAGSNFKKDDFHLIFKSNSQIIVGCSEFVNETFVGVLIAEFDFKSNKVINSNFESINDGIAAKLIQQRNNSKLFSNDEDWKDYDIAHLIHTPSNDTYFILEKRVIYAQGHPNIGRDVFDVSHNEELNGHVHAEGILVFKFNSTNNFEWAHYIPKNQTYPATDGLNTISFALDYNENRLKFLFAYHPSNNGNPTSLKYFELDQNGKELNLLEVPNPSNLLLVKDFTLFGKNNQLYIVGKKGILGKASKFEKIKLY